MEHLGPGQGHDAELALARARAQLLFAQSRPGDPPADHDELCASGIHVPPTGVHQQHWRICCSTPAQLPASLSATPGEG